MTEIKTDQDTSKVSDKDPTDGVSSVTSKVHDVAKS